MRKIWASALALTAGLGGAAQVGAAQAQEAVTSEEIVVTVQLREQSLLEVPIAVTAYGQEFLEQFAITKYDELALYVPGFEVQEQSANNTAFVIRGVTSDSGDATNEPRIAVFQDGVSTSRNRGTYMELFDIERIEVARGPQATLFGRGALVGAVNVIQNKADLNDPSFSATFAGGEDDYLRGTVVLNAPLVEDVFALRVAGTTRNREGYVENLEGGEDLGGVNIGAARVAMAFQPTTTLRFDLIGNIHQDDNSGTPFKSGTYAPAGSDLSYYSPARLNTFGGFEGGKPLGLDREVTSLTLIGEWEINPALTLTSITGSREFDSLEVFDPDGSSMPLIVAAEDAEGEQISQEFRLGWDNGGAFAGFVGVSYFHEEASTRAATQYDERYALAFATGSVPAPAIPDLATVQAIDIATLTALTGSAPTANFLYSVLNPAHREYYTNYGETDAIDVFADITWRVSDRIELTGGVRYTQEEKTSGLESGFTAPSVLGNLLALQGALAASDFATAAAIQTALGSGTPLPFGLFTQPQGFIERSDEFDGVTWRLVGRYEVSDAVSLWASYGRGRRPEVISLAPGNVPGTSTENALVPAETVDSIELGARAQNLFGGVLNLEGSLYTYEYADFQTTEIIAGAIRTVNAGEAKAYGFESAAQWRATDHLKAYVTYAYNHARFDGGARDGNSFRLSPDHTASLALRYERSVGIGSIYVTPSYVWQSEVFFDNDNDRADLQQPPLPGLADAGVDEVQEAYGLFNLRVGFEHASGHWGLGAFVNNALDEEYLIDAGNTGDSFTIPTFIRGAPRLWGVELTARF